MIIYPAIDLRNGHCVRFQPGNPPTETRLEDTPAAVARHWVSQGAEWLHIANLDGAIGATQAHLDILRRPANILVQRPGADKPESPEKDLFRRLPVNLCRLRDIQRAVNVPIQFSGGLHTLEDIRLVLELGAERVVLDAAVIEKKGLLEAALDQWGPERIVVEIAARDEKASAPGQRSFGQVNPVEFGHRLHALGVERLIYKDNRRDNGYDVVNVTATSRLADITGLYVIAGGSITNLGDIEQLKAHEHYNIEGVIVDQALYANQVQLSDAVVVGHRPLTRRSAGIVPYRHGPNGVEFLLLFNLFFEQWQFPRGGVHTGESDRACAERQLAEETGLSIQKFHEDCEVLLTYTASIRNYEIERTIVYYLAEVASSEIRLGHENHCEARWQNPQETWELLTETSPEQLPALDAALAYLQNKA
ncbi:MAG: HisA/HisF-related TIM barrel protein [Caldilineaceae bacterium]